MPIDAWTKASLDPNTYIAGITLSSIALLLILKSFLHKKLSTRSLSKYNVIELTSMIPPDTNDADDADDADDANDADDVSPLVSPRPHPSSLLRLLLLTTANICSLSALIISALSLAELHGTVLPRSLIALTPACSANLCHATALSFRITPPPALPGSSSFSLIVASDAQLDWFDGESPDLTMKYPKHACDETDSYLACEKKVGMYSNTLQVRPHVRKRAARRARFANELRASFKAPNDEF